MTTFGLPPDDSSDFASMQGFAGALNGHRGAAADSMPSSDGSGSTIAPYFHHDDEIDELINQAARHVEEFPLIATQPLTQSQQLQHQQHRAVKPDPEQLLVGCLIPATGKCERFELAKDKTSWTIGRNAKNDLCLPGVKLSNFHCKLSWNGLEGRHSEVVIRDTSSNGTWVNSVHLVGKSAILRGGVSISFGARPEPSNDWRKSFDSLYDASDAQRFIFRDIEGQSVGHMKQIWAKYDVGHELGAGAFARVHKCIERATGNEFAVKIIDCSKLRRSHANEAAVVREISILKQLAEFRHKNIVTLHEHFEEEDSIYLILELVRGGDLLSYIMAHGPIPELQVQRMAAQICHAVAYVHSQGIAHRDLKPENVMVTAGAQPDCKVADFGLAKLVGSGTFLRTMCGTPAYLAPEVMLRSASQAYDNKVDSWSLGIIFYCMLTNSSPFRDDYNPNWTAPQQQAYFAGRAVDWRTLDAAQLSEEGHDFLRHLLAEDPRARQSVAAMLDHSWIARLVPADAQFRRTPPPPPDAEACSQGMENLHLADLMPIPGLAPPVPSGESDVTRHIPGAFPGAGGVKRKDAGLVGAGSSPLSSLDEMEEEAAVPRRRVVRKKAAAAAAVAGRVRRRRASSEDSAAGAPRRSARHAAKAARHA